MAKLLEQVSTIDEHYNEVKGIRSSLTNKRFRRLPAFERAYYKKTCEVKKIGHNLEDIHRLHDGNLRHTTRGLTYSLNKKKRWLLPDIIEERICEYNPKLKDSKSEGQHDISNIDERLKIIMYENENIRHSSTCIRYGNNQIEPHILHKNGRRFNSSTLTKWMDFDTHERRNRRRRRNNNTDRVNQPNFGIQERPGFFPSEVTYEFLYPKHLPSSTSYKSGKTTLIKVSDRYRYDYHGRSHKDTNKNRRKIRRYECNRLDIHAPEYYIEEDISNDEYITISSDLIDENDKWSIVFEDTDDPLLASINFPIEYFIPSTSSSCKSTSFTNDNSSDNINDYKSRKYFEPLPTPTPPPQKSSITTDEQLHSFQYDNESDFLTLMQQSTMKITQANLSPPIFLQRTSSSSFSVIYTYDRQSSKVNVTLKYTGIRPKFSYSTSKITLEEFIQIISENLDENSIGIMTKSFRNTRFDVDELRGSLPLPMTILQNMLLTQPNSTDKQKIIEKENIHIHEKDQEEQWFNTTKTISDSLECSICCETLTTNNACQLLPCYHTLCHTCLTSYIRTSVSSATYSSTSTSLISCFQSDCSTHMNPSLLQGFISFEIYESYIQSLIDRHIFSTGNYRKCPSRVCSNLLIIDDNTKLTSMCSCGQRVCLQCFEEYHFPATCQQYKFYVARLRESGDDLLSESKIGDNSSCYIAEGKNCPNCGEFVEKNGGCPHMTCKCGNEYCWMCLKRWSTHNSSSCSNVPESTHELRSSTRNRLHNKAINHRRQRNQHTFYTLSLIARQSKVCSKYHDILLSTYIDLNTLAEFVYVLLQRRRTNIYIRAVLGQTANRLEQDAFQIKLQIECQQIKIKHIEQIRNRLERTLLNLLHMKNTKVLM
ncbi:unnamed protein product [Adineta steineri]|uniref:RBR-type E3 ubiquitin transferase n=1 Tax=Adineta steineri TaxID=433720 RepID=A0A814QHW7_9BILA|nr:unnamed protein product [Adineta steineri]CAF3769209.1 unnamed protein product [Adineta steineri]